MNSAFETFRADFPAFEHCTYLDLAGRSVLSRTTRHALDAGLDDQMLGRVVKTRWKAAAEEARILFARVLHVQASEVACTKNVSDGLNAIATALPWTAGDNLVYCPSFEHPNAAYAWLNFSRLGVELRPVPLLEDGRLDVAAIRRATDRRTRLVTVASVNFLTGMRAELGEIGRHCRAEGIFFLVDGAQSTGVLDTNVEMENIDGWCASANKGLLATYGLGFLYCRGELAAKLQPVYLSRFGVDAGELPEAEMGPADYLLYRGARRFEVGNANWTGLGAACASMRQLQQLGAAAIEERAVGLASRLAAGMGEAGFFVPRSSRRELQSHIVAVQGGAHGQAALERLDHALRAAGVVFSRRQGAIRFGLHAYNDESDVDKVIDRAMALR
jgi:cysteine desulfurase / selenocysteine lyase